MKTITIMKIKLSKKVNITACIFDVIGSEINSNSNINDGVNLIH